MSILKRSSGDLIKYLCTSFFSVANHINAGVPIGRSVLGSGQVCHTFPQDFCTPLSNFFPQSAGTPGRVKRPARISYSCGCQSFFSSAGRVIPGENERR